MNPSCDPLRLEELAAGRLAPVEATALEAHVAGCADCAEELRLLRAEQDLFARRAAREPALPPQLWAGVEARLVPPLNVISLEQRRRRATWGLGAALATAAALSLFMLRTPAPAGTAGGQTVATAPKAATPAKSADRLNAAEHAIDAAEESYRKAAALLEEEYAAGRPRLSPDVLKQYDTLVEDQRKQLVAMRSAAGHNVDARLKVVDGYAAYVHTLQKAVYDIPEAHR